jgi:hypothetical protein
MDFDDNWVQKKIENDCEEDPANSMKDINVPVEIPLAVGIIP